MYCRRVKLSYCSLCCWLQRTEGARHTSFSNPLASSRLQFLFSETTFQTLLPVKWQPLFLPHHLTSPWYFLFTLYYLIVLPSLYHCNTHTLPIVCSSTGIWAPQRQIFLFFIHLLLNTQSLEEHLGHSECSRSICLLGEYSTELSITASNCKDVLCKNTAICTCWQHLCSCSSDNWNHL